MPSKVGLNTLPVHPHLLASNADRANRAQLGKNATSSLADEAFASFREKRLTAPQKAQLASWDFLFDKSKSTIEQHLEKRVSQLFVQAVACYGTGYRFREGHTIHQGLGAHTIQDGKDTKITFQAAHSATVPCLYVTRPNSNVESVYLYRSGIYDESQATVDVVKAVNDADRAIDEKYTSSQLRKKAVELLNKAAQGELTPEEVSKQFAKDLIDEIDTALGREASAEVKDVLQLYRDKAALLWSYVDHPEHIDRWLDLDMSDPLLADLSALVADIQEGNDVDREQLLTLIRRKISDLTVVIRHERHQKQNEARMPSYFQDLYHLHVLKLFKGDDLKVVEEALGINLQTLSTRAKRFKKIDTTNAVLLQNAAKIADLAKALLPLVAKAQGNEIPDADLEGISNGKKVCLRPDIYQLRYRMIRQDQEAQGVIKSKVESVYNRIKTSTPYFDIFFNHTLLSKFSPSERMLVCRLLNISGQQLTQQVRELKVNSRVFQALEKGASSIANLATRIQQAHTDAEKKSAKTALDQVTREILSACLDNKEQVTMLLYRRLIDQCDPKKVKHMEGMLGLKRKEIDDKIAEWSKKTASEVKLSNQDKAIQEIVALFQAERAKLTIETTYYRRRLFVELRQTHGMKYEAFIDRYKESYSDSPMSLGTLNNLEHGRKAITPELVAQISEIFGVTPQLFNPSHFAES